MNTHQDTIIIKPTTALVTSYRSFIDEYLDDPQSYYTALKDCFELCKKDARVLIHMRLAWAEGEKLQPGYVPENALWAVHDERIVGEVIMRRGLTPVLENFGGQVTYYVLPAYRSKGIATLLLKAAQELAEQYDMPNLLICCDDKNAASISIIEKSGGQLLEVKNNLAEFGEMTRRYHIPSESE